MNGYGRCFTWLAVGALLGGCGGISDAGMPSDGAGSGEQGEAGESLRATLVWTMPLSTYGLNGRAFLSVDPGETRVLVPPARLLGDGYVELSLLDGASLLEAETPILGRDATWTRDLRSPADYYFGVDVIDRGSAAPRLIFPGPLGGAGLSADGRFVATMDCARRELVRSDVATGDAISVSFAAFPEGCRASVDAQPAPIVLTPGGEVALFSWSMRGALGAVDFRSRTATLHTRFALADAESVYPGDATILAIEPSPSGRRVAVTAVGEPVRVFSLDELDAPVLELASSSLGAFGNCYCVRRTFAPVAWSPDESRLALLDEQGVAVLRRSSDGALLGELPGTPRGDGEESRGAHLLAFTPSGTGVVSVLYDETVGGRVAFYRLSE